MNTMVLIILLGVLFIDVAMLSIEGKLWKAVLEQRRHNNAVEQLLAELRDRMKPPR